MERCRDCEPVRHRRRDHQFRRAVAALTADYTGDDEPFAEARMLAADCGGMRIVSIYAPNGREVDSPFYRAKLLWFDKLTRWLEWTNASHTACVIGGDFNVAPQDIDVWDPAACHGGTHVSNPERRAFERIVSEGFIDAYRVYHPEAGRYTWWDYRAGNFHKNIGMRIDHLLVSGALGNRLVWSEDRSRGEEGKAVAIGPRPSGHRLGQRRASLRRRLGLGRVAPCCAQWKESLSR